MKAIPAVSRSKGYVVHCSLLILGNIELDNVCPNQETMRSSNLSPMNSKIGKLR